MAANEPSPNDEMGRVVPFQRKARARKTRNAPAEGGPVEDIEKYAQDREADDYPQRMTNNGLALLFLLVLVGLGVWLATTMSDMRRKEDCVLSGRRDCVALPQGAR